MRPTQAIVDLAALRHNLSRARQFSPAARQVAVVKANAYGHGAAAVARALAPKADALAVAFIEEAVSLRDAGIDHPILVLEGPDRSDDLIEAATRGFWLMLHDEAQVRRVSDARLPAPVNVWLKVDTGMHRLGLGFDAARDAVERLADARVLAGPPVLCTHLACADDRDSGVTGSQVASFRRFAGAFNLPISMANSAGILFWPDSHADWNRPGYMLYGHCPSGRAKAPDLDLRPAMRLVSKLMATRTIAAGESVGYGHRWRAARTSVIGTVPIGYADGYPRHAPNGTPVLVGGRRVPLVGTVSMDMITVDLTEAPGAALGDPVELWGEGLSVNEIAASAGTIGYQLLAGLTGRVPVLHVNA